MESVKLQAEQAPRVNWQQLTALHRPPMSSHAETVLCDAPSGYLDSLRNDERTTSRLWEQR